MELILKLQRVKKHLKIDHDYEDDYLLEDIIPGAESSVRATLDDSDAVLPYYRDEPMYRIAALLMCGVFYENRSAISVDDKKVLETLDDLHFKLKCGVERWKSLNLETD